MKPDWDKLMDAFADSKTALIADIDCTTAGKELCELNDVKGYPTLKWGDPSDLQDYQGGRDYKTLEKFAAEKLKPICSPKNIDLCDEEKKAEIEKFSSMSTDDLNAAIKKEEKKITDAESTFTSELDNLQASYKKLMDDKETAIAEVKASGLGLMKAVRAHTSSKENDEL